MKTNHPHHSSHNHDSGVSELLTQKGIRRKFGKVGTTIILSMIIIVFVAWGVGNVNSGTADLSVVASVNDDVVKLDEIKRALFMQKQQLGELLKSNPFYEQYLNSPQNVMRMVDNQIQGLLLTQLMDDYKLKVLSLIHI